MSRAAELGPPAAQYELASMLADGRGTPRDMEAAMMWGRNAAEQSYAPAQFAAAKALLNSGEQVRKKEAIEMLSKAAQGGEVKAVLFLAAALCQGEYGLLKDESRAEALLLPWAEKGNADCQFALASIYKFGENFGGRRDEMKIWLRRAADQGHAEAIKVLNAEEPR
ncbi:MAG: tetratricopeptide repeat protein [Chthoniobacterales bacterium]